jgi:hypothetical protein
MQIQNGQVWKCIGSWCTGIDPGHRRHILEEEALHGFHWLLWSSLIGSLFWVEMSETNQNPSEVHRPRKKFRNLGRDPGDDLGWSRKKFRNRSQTWSRLSTVCNSETTLAWCDTHCLIHMAPKVNHVTTSDIPWQARSSLQNQSSLLLKSLKFRLDLG